jgi:hypothetical protein
MATRRWDPERVLSFHSSSICCGTSVEGVSCPRHLADNAVTRQSTILNEMAREKPSWSPLQLKMRTLASSCLCHSHGRQMDRLLMKWRRSIGAERDRLRGLRQSASRSAQRDGAQGTASPTPTASPLSTTTRGTTQTRAMNPPTARAQVRDQHRVPVDTWSPRLGTTNPQTAVSPASSAEQANVPGQNSVPEISIGQMATSTSSPCTQCHGRWHIPCPRCRNPGTVERNANLEDADDLPFRILLQTQRHLQDTVHSGNHVAPQPRNQESPEVTAAVASCPHRHVPRRPVATDCIICTDPMRHVPLGELRWCKATCGNSFHAHCLEHWFESAPTGRSRCPNW